MKKSEMVNGTISGGRDAVELLNLYEGYRRWSLGDDVFCRWCDSVFKVVDMVTSPDGPACPMCGFAVPDALDAIPWWRRDLVAESRRGDISVYTWRVKPIRAVIGKPERLPHRPVACGDGTKKP